MALQNRESITIYGLTFVQFINDLAIRDRVSELAEQINADYKNEAPIFLILLNGAYVFAADLLRNIDGNAETHFLKISSYEDLHSTGKVSFEKYNLEKLQGRKIVIIEDIIDTATTIHSLLQYLDTINVTDVKICSLLVKRNKFKYPLRVHYVGFEISDEFVVGYGLDYNENGRNLPHIYQLKITE